MYFTAAQVAGIINGEVEGDSKVTVSSFGKIEEAVNGQLAFLANPKYEDYLYTTKASIIIIDNLLHLKHPVHSTLIRVKDPYSAFATLLDVYQKVLSDQLSGIQKPVFISESAKLDKEVFVGAFTYIGENVIVGKNSKLYPQVYIGDNVRIGENTILYPGVKVYKNSVIGNNVIIHSGSVIGGDGFGFAPQPDGSLKKVPQIGNVIIEDNVEIGANATIDRATLGSTIIKTGTKIDNLVQIAHNVEIGPSTVIAAQAGVSGSTKDWKRSDDRRPGRSGRSHPGG
jgi:UDP-3-O-[3-hydroxymyristoyl] glucosamine N-acyltransferase